MFKKEEVKNETLKYFNGDELATNVFFKYALKNKKEEYLELTPADMHKRLAKEFARIESKYLNPISYDDILVLFENFKYIVPQGSPMFGIGNNYSLSSLSNCVVVESPKDNISSIMDSGKELANLFKRRCGVGADLSELRPENTPVNNSAGTTSGAWTFADFYSFVCKMIGQNGRRGALMLSMDVKHPDIFQFVKMKHDLTKVTGANVSVKISDEFMNAVEEDRDFELQFPVNSPNPSIRKLIRAKDLWKEIVKSATKTAEPGILMWDNILKNLPANEYRQFRTICVNPCLTGDSIVKTVDGDKTIKELAENKEKFKVYSYDEKDKKVVTKNAIAFKTKENAKLMKIKTKSGKVLRLTPEHKVLTDKGWIEAQNLTKEHKLIKIKE